MTDDITVVIQIEIQMKKKEKHENSMCDFFEIVCNKNPSNSNVHFRALYHVFSCISEPKYICRINSLQ